MVYLADLRNEWPWKANAEPQMEDKEILTQTILQPGKDWLISVLPPMRGYAFIGIRFVAVDGTQDDMALARLVRQDTGIRDSTVFGFPWDQALLNHGMWRPLGFPLSHSLCNNVHLEIILQMDKAFVGKVELLAQKIDDLMDGEVLFGFLNDRKQRLEWIQDRAGHLRIPDANSFYERVKVVPGLHRLLDKKEPEWEDRAYFWFGVDDDRILYDIPQYPALQEIC